MYYYSGFPIVRVTDRRLVGWRNDSVSGARALAIDYPNIALLGGYGPDADLLTVGVLSDDRLEIRQQYRVVMPDGTPLARQAFIGRGPTLHMVHAHNWYQLSLTDMGVL